MFSFIHAADLHLDSPLLEWRGGFVQGLLGLLFKRK